MDRPVGSLVVDQNGYATYQYNITVPPGIGQGNEPAIALSYVHGGPNGILGSGWSLASLSSVVLAPPSLAIDGQLSSPSIAFASRYVLDGRQLVCISGTYGEVGAQYKPEIDFGYTITSVVDTTTGIQGFELTDIYGQSKHYGTTTDSQTPASPGSDVIVEWRLSKSVDPHQNYVSYNYTTSPTLTPNATSTNFTDVAVSYLDSINYTSNDTANYTGKLSTKFLYNARPDPILATIQATQTTLAHRLEQIQTLVADVSDNTFLARQYNLGYAQSPATGNSLLVSILELGSSGNAVGQPTTFEYSGANLSANTFGGEPQTSFDLSDATNNNLELLPLDLTGRGFADLACIQFSDGQLVARTYIGSPTSSAQGDPTLQWSIPSTPSTVSLASISTSQTTAQAQVLVSDIDNDGRSDLVVPYNNMTDANLHIAIAKSEGTGLAQVVDIATNVRWVDACTYLLMDCTGDGQTDMIRIAYDDQTYQYSLDAVYAISTATTGTTLIPTSSGPFSIASTTQLLDWMVFTFQRSGAQSLVQICDVDMTTYHQIEANVFTPQGDLFKQSGFAPLSSPIVLGTYEINDGVDRRQVLVCDPNGDAAQDIVLCTYSGSQGGDQFVMQFNFATWLNDGNGGFGSNSIDSACSIQVETAPLSSSTGNFYLMNMNGSMYPSIVFVYQDENFDWSCIVAQGSSSGQVGMLLTNPSATAVSNLVQMPIIDRETLGPYSSNFVLTPTDVNCVGRGAWLVSQVNASGGSALPIYNQTTIPDLLLTATSPLGLQQEISYAPLSANSLIPSTSIPVYTSSVAWDNYPVNANDDSYIPCIASTRQVVAQVSESNDPSINGLTYEATTQYEYQGGSVNLAGRGWMGMACVTSTDITSGIQYVSNYATTWPSAGTMMQKDTLGSSHNFLTQRMENYPFTWDANAESALTLMQSTIFTYALELPTNNNQVDINLFQLMSKRTYTYTEESSGPQRSFGLDYTYSPGTTSTLSEHWSEQDETSQPPTTLSELYTFFEYAPNTLGIAMLPQARKVTTSSLQPDFSVFNDDTDLGLTTYVYDSTTSILQSIQEWSSDLGMFTVQQFSFDKFGNQTSKVNEAGMTIATEFDPVYHTYAIKETLTGTNPDGTILNQTSYAGFDPRYGTRFIACTEYGTIEVTTTDEWGRALVTSTVAMTTDTDQSPITSPNLLVFDGGLKNSMQNVPIVPSKSVTYATPASSSGNYICKEIQTYYESTSTAFLTPQQELIDCKSRIRKIATQSNDPVAEPVAWTYKDYDSAGNLVLQSYPTIPGVDGLDWTPIPNTCNLSVFDALKRSVFSVRPPTVITGPYAVTETIFSDGGAMKTTSLTESSTFDAVTSSNRTPINTIEAQFVRVANKLCVSATSYTYGYNLQFNNGKTTNFTYDALGRLKNCTDPGSRAEERTYNSKGAILTINNPYQNPSGQTSPAIQRKYDSSNRLIQETNAMDEISTYEYDVKGRLLKRTDWDNRITEYTWDQSDVGVGVLASVTISQSGSQLPEIQYAYTYDARARKSTETLTFGSYNGMTLTTSFEYDRQNQVTQKTLPDNTLLSRAYAGRNLTSVELQGPAGEDWSAIANYSSYTAAGLPSQWTITGDGNTAMNFSGTALYSVNSLPTELTLGVPDGANAGNLVDYTFTYNSQDQIVTLDEQIQGLTTSYTYELSRLSSSTSGSQSQTNDYSYDGSGNLANKAGMSLVYSVPDGGGAQVVGTTNDEQVYSCKYDNAGRMISRLAANYATTVLYTYDGYGKIRTIQNGTETRTLYSDHNYRTVARSPSPDTTEIRVCEDFDIIFNNADQSTAEIRCRLYGAQRILATVTKSFTSGQDSPTPTSVGLEAYMTNHKGTVTHIFGGDGSAQNVLVYDDFGLLTSIGTPGEPSLTEDVARVTYEAAPIDVFSGLLELGARSYDPVLGRFTTPDTELSVKSMIVPDGLNRMAFERNDPINHMDPTGHWTWSFWVAAAVGVGLIAAGLALSVATGGAAVPLLTTVLLGAASGALMGAGAAGLFYAVQNRNEPNAAKFWKGWAIETVVGAAVGAATGAAGGWLDGSFNAGSQTLESSSLVKSLEDQLLDASDKNLNAITRVLGRAVANSVGNIINTEVDNSVQNWDYGTHNSVTWQALVEDVGFGSLLALKGAREPFAQSTDDGNPFADWNTTGITVD